MLPCIVECGRCRITLRHLSRGPVIAGGTGMSVSKALSRVRKLMSSPVICVEPNMNVLDALALAREHAVSHLPVVSSDGVLGVVCTCDLEDASLTVNVSSVMHAPIIGVSPADTLATAAELMARTGVGSVLVLDGEDLVGILSRRDVEGAGLADAAFGERRCTACGSYHHIRVEPRCGFFLCSDCRQRARSGPDGEIGGSG